MWRVLFMVSGPSADRRGSASVASTDKGVSAARCTAAGLLLLAAACVATERSPAAAGESARDNVTVHGVASPAAARIRGHAEEVRATAFASLLGERSPRPWLPRCAIHVHATPAAFAAAVGGPPDVAQGATSIEFSGAMVSLRRIDVLADPATPIPPALAHELVHVVLADRFTDGPPPRWADEGLAILFDVADRQVDHERDFRAARARGMAWSAADLVSLEDYPPGAERQRVFYGQSAALVRWLIGRKDAPSFIRFVEACPEHGVAPALAQHYGLKSIGDLERAWKEVPPMHTLGLAGRSP